ncbi:MAG: ATPase domain-containing protein [Candidatus Altiarchaeota archaeon]|nr:ATPase domain-containing protein [Candidatus Altiarchaeota archaeon]
MEMERIKTGISGLDELIGGGFPKGYSILVSGAPGTGKSIFGLGYLYTGAMEGQKGIYVSLLQGANELLDQAEMFGWNLRSKMAEGLLEMLEVDTSQFDISKILNDIKKGGYDRVVIDSLSHISFHPIPWQDVSIAYSAIRDVDAIIPDPKHPLVASRILTETFLTKLKKLGVTSIVISESGDVRSFEMDTLPESLTDGVINLRYELTGPVKGRNLVIKKMRATGHSEVIHPLEFVEGLGIKVLEP